LETDLAFGNRMKTLAKLNDQLKARRCPMYIYTHLAYLYHMGMTMSTAILFLLRARQHKRISVRPCLRAVDIHSA
jgi:hypothetical protein